jgi:hypothetical protein
VLTLSSLVRSYLVASLSSHPLLFRPSFRILRALAHSPLSILNPDRNPVLRWLLKRTFYAQFCAGENAVEVRRTVASLKATGYHGVILGYARRS